jgi:glycine hydroxymethyltransferase
LCGGRFFIGEEGKEGKAKMFARDHLIERIDPAIAAAIEAERRRQEDHIELIASENYTSPAVMEAQGCVLTNKYAEGYPGARYYGGCAEVDVAENLARERACALFGAQHANVQPHSGSQANQAAFFAAVKPGDTVLGMALDSGGHLTHGAKVNFSGRLYNSITYGLNPDSEDIDYESAARLAEEHRPKLIICGASAFSLKINWAKFREIADAVGAVVLADMAHYSGLIAAGLYPSPVGSAQFVSSTTHKSLRGPRGGFVLTDADYARPLDSAVFPRMQGGPLMHIIAAKAVAFCEAAGDDFRAYQRQVIKNAQTLAGALASGGLRIVSGGTESHVFLVDLRGKNISGKLAERALDRAHITLNKNAIPGDPAPPTITSGVRIGTPAITTRGFGEAQCGELAELILRVLDAPEDDAVIKAVAGKARALCAAHPVYEKR